MRPTPFNNPFNNNPFNNPQKQLSDRMRKVNEAGYDDWLKRQAELRRKAQPGQATVAPIRVSGPLPRANYVDESEAHWGRRIAFFFALLVILLIAARALPHSF